MVGWSTRRQFLYIAVAAVVVAVLLLWIYLAFFTTAPTCFDNKKNGDEVGIDCGGSCARICLSDAHPATVLWSRAFVVSSGNYAAAAYVQNTNAGAGAKGVHYTFQLFDSANSLVAERDGVVDLPPVQTIPVIETGIDVGYRKVTRALFSFSQEPTWSKVSAGTLPAISLSEELLSADGRRLSAMIANNSLYDVSNIIVVVVLFDSKSNAVATSKSTIGLLQKKSSRQIVFTWPNAITDVSHAEVTVLPPF